MNLYTIVTNDAYELPVLCDVRAAAAAEYLHTTPEGIRRMVCRPPRRSEYKPVVAGQVTHDSRRYYRNYSQTHDRTEYMKRYYQKNRERYHQRYKDRREKMNQAE